MVRRSTPTRLQAEQYFPVRVRIAVPSTGFGHQLDVMQGWLDDHVGKERYSSSGSGNRSDAACFYFFTTDDAKAFVDRFACGLMIGCEWAR
jgi:hypothetical protein